MTIKTTTSRCYWCGEPATSEDHVPAKCFYPAGMRANLIKVPSCNKHNNKLSKVDDRFRFYIQAVSNSPVAKGEIRGATGKSFSRPEAAGFRASILKDIEPVLLDGRPTFAGRVDATLIQTFFEKITRGLYFHHTGVIFSGSITSECTHFSKSHGTSVPQIISCINDMAAGLAEGQITHPDVFNYRYGQVTDSDGHAFVVVGRFYGDVSFFTFGTQPKTSGGGERPCSAPEL